MAVPLKSLHEGWVVAMCGAASLITVPVGCEQLRQDDSIRLTRGLIITESVTYPAFRKLIEGPSRFSERPTEWAYPWYGSPAADLPANHFATVAKGSVIAPTGKYEIDITSDDGVRV